ncbi:MAG: DUF3226 domain-containing protein [Candidatus Xenobia bacterium]
MARTITEDRLVVVEGRDEEVVLEAFKASRAIAGVQVLQVEGVNNIRLELAALVRTPGFDRVTRLAVVRDADDDWDAAFTSVLGGLANAALPVPPAPLVLAGGTPSVAVLILPDVGQPGDLETICLRSVAGDSALPCVDEYLQCLGAAGHATDRHINKRRALAFLASRPRVHKTLGHAAHGNVWNFGSQAFQPIQQLFDLLTS